MGRFLMLLLVCGLTLAVLKAALLALLAAFVVVLVWGFLAKPIETIAGLLLGAWVTLMQTHTFLGLLVLAGVICLGAWKRRPKANEPADEQHNTLLLPILGTPDAEDAPDS